MLIITMIFTGIGAILSGFSYVYYSNEEDIHMAIIFGIFFIGSTLVFFNTKRVFFKNDKDILMANRIIGALQIILIISYIVLW